MKLANKIEHAAQRLYDLRDSAPAEDRKTWDELNRIATRLSKLAGRLERCKGGE